MLKQQYTAEYRQEAVRHALESQESIIPRELEN